MKYEERQRLLDLASKVRGKALELTMLAEEIEAYAMKQTTQRSPEFRSDANCVITREFVEALESGIELGPPGSSENIQALTGS